MFQRILLPLDGSAQAEEALPIAASLVRRIGACSGRSTISLLCVISSPLTPIGEYPYSWERPELLMQMREQTATQARAYLSRLILTEHLEDIHPQVEVREGMPVPSILEWVRENQIDLIVLRSHGATGIKRWLLGSVAREIARHSPVPVFIIRNARTSAIVQQQGPQHPLRILVPLDGSALAERALLPAAELSAALASPAQGAIHLTQTIHHIHEAGERHKELIKRMNKETQAETAAYLKNVEQRFSTGDLAQFHLHVTSSVTPHSDSTEIWKRIIDEAEGDGQVPGCDIIAMATHGRHGLEHFLTGSVTESVLDASTYPLLVVPAHGGEIEEKEV